MKRETSSRTNFDRCFVLTVDSKTDHITYDYTYVATTPSRIFWCPNKPKGRKKRQTTVL